MVSSKRGSKKLAWNPSGEAAFKTLKSVFTSAPIVNHPDPAQPFTVEVEASDKGVGSVLSQCFGEKPKLHPVSFFSRKLSPTKQNYDVGNRELLTIKLALKEWRHWLEHAKHPFVVFTDNKNLEYLCTTKRLNLRQAQWALFFIHLHFTLSYGPGSCNTKADSLPHQHRSQEPEPTLEPILPPSCFINAITWEFDQELAHTLPYHTNLTNVSPCLRAHLIMWAHTSPANGHPGVQCSYQLLKAKYW